MNAIRATDRLFFAVIPDERTVVTIAALRRRLLEETGISGKEVLPKHLHVTLWHVGDSYEPPTPDVIAVLVRRAGYVEMPSFRISFTRAQSFSGGALVLTGDRGVAGLESLSTKLRDVLVRPGVKKERPFMPHMTLLRSETILPMRDIAPITWTAREIVLVHSLLGRTTHRHLARLPLGPGDQLSLF
jgi:2'-5' RNA ligase